MPLPCLAMPPAMTPFPVGLSPETEASVTVSSAPSSTMNTWFLPSEGSLHSDWVSTRPRLIT